MMATVAATPGQNEKHQNAKADSILPFEESKTVPEVWGKVEGQIEGRTAMVC